MKYLSKIINSAFGYLYHAIQGKNLRLSNNLLPNKIFSYRLKKDFQPEKNFPFKVGLYQNSRGHRVVIKIWRGKFKDVHYYDLLHQKESLQLLNTIHRRCIKLLPKTLQNVRFPKVEFFRNEKHRLLLASEYVSGVPINQISSPTKQVHIYNNVVEYLRLLGTHCRPEEARQLRYKNLRTYLSLFPLLILVAILENPRDIFLIAKLLFVYLFSTLGFIQNKSLTLVHGDLNFKNIYVHGPTYYLLDTEQISFTYPEFETVTSLSTMSTPGFFKKYLIQHINQYVNTSISNRLKIVFLLLNCELQNLTWHAPRENITWYKKIINFGLYLFSHKNGYLRIESYENTKT